MSADIIDRAALRRLLDVIGGDPEDLHDLLEDYRSMAPELASQISAAAVSGDLDALRIAAHSLKSNARDFGALRLSSVCEELERSCRSGAVPDACGMAEAIVSEEIAARQALTGLAAEDLSD
jgi:HPt (histidine-containing phosphotransfer) domain-containing protein